MAKEYADAGVIMRTQMWIKMRTVLNGCPLSSERYSERTIAIKNYDELIDWMIKNKEMWELVNIETDYINNVYWTDLKDNVNVRNLYYVFE